MVRLKIHSVTLAFLANLFFMLFVSNVIAEERFALVIGNSDYDGNQWIKLPNTINDAQDITTVLEQYGFTVFYKENLTLTEMQQEFIKFLDYLTPSNVGLFYYAGHGIEIQNEGGGYLIPANIAPYIGKDAVMEQSLPVYTISNRMRQNRKHGLNIIILDTCRENPFQHSRTEPARTLPINRSLATLPSKRGIGGIANQPVNKPSGTIIGYATSPNSFASENPEGRNGLYTKHLLQAMQTPGLTLQAIFQQAKEAVAHESGNQQISWVTDGLFGGNFCFTTCQTQPPRALQIFQDSLLNGGLGPEMVIIPSGRFQMGDLRNTGDIDEKPVHQVNLEQFAIGRYEITVKQFQQFVQATKHRTGAEIDGKGCYTRRGSLGWSWRRNANWQNTYFKTYGKQHPVVCVNWHDAVAYTEWLTAETRKPYALPSEAQWEYMARASTQSDYWWGNQIAYNRANCWKTSRWHQTVAPIGSFPANSFKVHDTVGNVWEWVADSWHPHYGGVSLSREIRQVNEHVPYRIVRGGSWVSQPAVCRVSERAKRLPEKNSARIGFRVAIEELVN